MSHNKSTPNTTNIENFNSAIIYLVKAYKLINSEQANYLQQQIDIIRSADDNKQSVIAWNIVNTISGRNTINKAKLKANNQTERHMEMPFF